MLQKLLDKVRGGTREGVHCSVIHLDDLEMTIEGQSTVLLLTQKQNSLLPHVQTIILRNSVTEL